MNVEDFDPKKAIENINSKLEQPHKFSDIFCKALSSQKQMDDAIAETVKKLLRTDAQVQNSIENLIKEYDKSYKTAILKRFLGSIEMILISLISGAAVYFLK